MTPATYFLPQFPCLHKWDNCSSMRIAHCSAQYRQHLAGYRDGRKDEISGQRSHSQGAATEGAAYLQGHRCNFVLSVKTAVIEMISCSRLTCDLRPRSGVPSPPTPSARSAPPPRVRSDAEPVDRSFPGWAGRGLGRVCGRRSRGVQQRVREDAAGGSAARRGGSTLQERTALAVRGAPEPGCAVLAARQQTLPVRAQTEPVDAPAVVSADPQGRPSAPHRASQVGHEEAAPRYGEAPQHPRGCSLRLRPVVAAGGRGARLLRGHGARRG